MPNKSLHGRIAIVTGSSRGIGAAIARMLAREGASVGVNYLNSRDEAEAVVKGISEEGGRAIAVQADAGEISAVLRMVETVHRTFGPPDTLVLNADGGQFRPTPFAQLNFTDYSTRLTSEMKLAMFPVKAVLPAMLASKHGRIIAIGSALCRAPNAGFSTLAVSKAALESFVRSLAVELGPHGIRVNVVEASMTETENASVVVDSERESLINSIPLRRIGRPEDVAGAVVFLASDHANFINGAVVPVNGGQVMF
jgi:3-oxoacyl-[acyl-carrier protein] reductase